MEKKYVAKLAGITAISLLSATLLKNKASKSDARGKVVIVGGGTAGITVAARLSRALKHPDITIVEPSAEHQYQPGYTLIASGVFNLAQVSRYKRPERGRDNACSYLSSLRALLEH